MRYGKFAAGMALVALMGVAPALADGKGHKNGHGKDRGKHDRGHAAQHCPPGLAKKNPPCVPPGQAKKYAPEIYRPQVYDRGDHLPGDAVYLHDPRYYGLPDGTYYVDNGRVYRVDPQTLEVMALIGLVERLLN